MCAHSSGLIGVVLFFVLVSTMYDIICTIKNRKYLRVKLLDRIIGCALFSELLFKIDECSHLIAYYLNSSSFVQVPLYVFTGNKSQALLAFSAYTNGVKLLSYKKPKSSEVMSCVNGIRVLTTQWVVLGHTFGE